MTRLARDAHIWAPQSLRLTVESRKAEYAQRNAQRSRVGWEVSWAKPSKDPDIHTDMPLEEAERHLSQVVRTAIHHAVVSGESTVTIKVYRSKATYVRR